MIGGGSGPFGPVSHRPRSGGSVASDAELFAEIRRLSVLINEGQRDIARLRAELGITGPILVRS